MKWIVLTLICFLPLAGCSSYTPPVYKMGDLETDSKASNIPDSKTVKDLTVGAKLFANSSFCNKFFGIDLVYEGLVPILVAFENPKGNNSFVINPKNMTLTILSEKGRDTLKPIKFSQLGYGREVEQHIDPKLFPDGWKLNDGEAKNGFVLFDARKYGWSEGGMQKALKDALLEIKMRKEKLPKPEKPKEGVDPSKYRGETVKVKILFD